MIVVANHIIIVINHTLAAYQHLVWYQCFPQYTFVN